jgi:hypothetical protein
MGRVTFKVGASSVGGWALGGALKAVTGLPGAAAPGLGGRLIRIVSFLIFPWVTFIWGLVTELGALGAAMFGVT